MKKITVCLIKGFEEYLICDEKSKSTIAKYVHDVIEFKNWLGGKETTKELAVTYKEYLTEKFAPASVNAAIASLNSFFSYNSWYECRLKPLKIQRQPFAKKEKELTKDEYYRLLDAARKKGDCRLYYIMQTICATGIRVSELKFITAEAIAEGQAVINCKGKMRVVLLPKQLRKILKQYIGRFGIKRGSIFVTKNGMPIDRSNIWAAMKKICESAGVSENKVFPHNLRHLFARTFYKIQKDIVSLADVLGHSSINTTRIYTIENAEECMLQIQRLGLLKI